jgi:hypothetical protein
MTKGTHIGRCQFFEGVNQKPLDFQLMNLSSIRRFAIYTQIGLCAFRSITQYRCLTSSPLSKFFTFQYSRLLLGSKRESLPKFLNTFNQYFSNVFKRTYSSVIQHPNQPASSTSNTQVTAISTTPKIKGVMPNPFLPLDPEKVINAVQETLKEEEITQETMLCT